MRVFAIFVILLCFIPLVTVAEDYYQFDNQNQQQRFQTLTTSLRCLVCQNQNIAESNAALATDLRNQVYQQIRAGASDQAITDYLVKRYGNFILYNPPLNSATLILWVGPFAIIMAGIIILLCYIGKHRRNHL